MKKTDQKTFYQILRPVQTLTQTLMIWRLIRLQPTITMWAGDSWRRGTVEVVLWQRMESHPGKLLNYKY